MKSTRRENQQDLFETIFQGYLILIKDKNNSTAAEDIFSVLCDLDGYKKGELIYFAMQNSEFQGNKMTGISLILWVMNNTYLIEKYRNIFNLCNSLITDICDLKDVEFNQLDFSSETYDLAANRERLFFKLIGLPKDKLQTLCLDNPLPLIKGIENWGRSFGSVQIINLADLIVIAPRYDAKELYSLISRRPFSPNSHPALLSLLRIINNLKNVLNEQASLSLDELNKKFTGVIIEDGFLRGNSDYHYALSKAIHQLTPSGTDMLPVSAELLTSIISSRKLNLEALNECRYALANHLFTKIQSDLTEKLAALKRAFCYAFERKLTMENEDNFLIVRIAEAFLYANNRNLNDYKRGIDLDLPAFDWLRQQIDTVQSQYPLGVAETQLDEIIMECLTKLTMQRDFIYPLMIENAQLKESLQQLEQKVEKLMKICDLKEELAEKKPHNGFFQ